MDIGGVFEHQSGQFVQGSLLVPTRTELIDFLGGQTKHLAQFPNSGPVLKGIVGALEGHMLETLEDIGRDIVPVPSGEINVKIRGRGPKGIDEPFEIQVQFNGVHIGDPN